MPMLSDAKMLAILDGLSRLDDPAYASARTYRYADVLAAVSRESGFEGEGAYKALFDWVDTRGDIEVDEESGLVFIVDLEDEWGDGRQE